jgi:hypothetical protein
MWRANPRLPVSMNEARVTPLELELRCSVDEGPLQRPALVCRPSPLRMAVCSRSVSNLCAANAVRRSIGRPPCLGPRGVESASLPRHDMTKLEAIEEQIRALSPGELAELRDWLLEHDWEEWDRQIERDSAAGKLEKLFTKARADHEAGKSTKL